MSERSLWVTFRKNLGPLGKLTRIESATGPGIPDVHGLIGGGSFWCELKRLENWPKRASTPVRIPHYTDDQRRWLKEYGANGGRAWLLVQIERDYLLFGHHTAQLVGYLRKETLCELARQHHPGRCDWGLLAAALGNASSDDHTRVQLLMGRIATDLAEARKNFAETN